MANIIIKDEEYVEWISSLSSRYRQSRLKAAGKVNSEKLLFYWSLGHDIVELHAESKWGEDFYRSMSCDLKSLLPEAGCFSDTNLRYMKRFYMMYKDYYTILPRLGAEAEEQLAWQVSEQIEHDLFMIP